MSDLVEMYRKALQEESKMLGTPNSCTINRAMELVFSAYNLGKTELEEQHLRERYAGLAMQVIVSHPQTIQKIVDMLKDKGDEKASRLEEVVAKQAISFADALIEQLNKEE